MWPFRRGNGEGISRKIETSHDAVSDIKRGRVPKEAWGEDSDPDLTVDKPQMMSSGKARVSVKEPGFIPIDSVIDPNGKTPEDLLLEKEKRELGEIVTEPIQKTGEGGLVYRRNEDPVFDDDKSSEQSGKKGGGMIRTLKGGKNCHSNIRKFDREIGGGRSHGKRGRKPRQVA